MTRNIKFYTSKGIHICETHRELIDEFVQSGCPIANVTKLNRRSVHEMMVEYNDLNDTKLSTLSNNSNVYLINPNAIKAIPISEQQFELPSMVS